MRHALTVMAVALAGLALAACESTGGYDGVSRFADTGGHAGGVAGAYDGPGNPPRDFGGAPG
jgi:hypothetical protein